MTLHSAQELLAETQEPDGRVRARLRLVCGCVIERAVASDRILEAEDGRRFAVGKYPCPLDHPVGPRPPPTR